MSHNLNSRIGRLERQLQQQSCLCADAADLGWPGHRPSPICWSCGGQRFIYPLGPHPGAAEPLIREALPILRKAYVTDDRADLTRLTDDELTTLKTALQAVEQADRAQSPP